MRQGIGTKIRRLCLLALAVTVASGCTWNGPDAAQPQKLQMEYYYVPACENCEEGPGYAAALEQQLSDVMQPGEDYELTLRDLSDEAAYEAFQSIVETYQTDTFYPAPPVMVIGSEYLFGQDEIESLARSTAIRQRNALLTAEQVRERLGEAEPEDSVFVYFYKEDCPYCHEIESYLAGLEHTQYLEDGTPSQLKILYVDAGRVENMPLVGEMYDRFQVPEEERKSPMIFWKGGYAMGRAAIRETIIPTILSGEAQGWPGWEQVPVS